MTVQISKPLLLLLATILAFALASSSSVVLGAKSRSHARSHALTRSHASASSAASVGNNNYMLWNNEKGSPVVVFPSGETKVIETIWACYAAWNDAPAVAREIRSMISRGIVPYVQSYCFGDNGLRGEFHKAVAFDKSIAGAIGSSLAFVNLDTEWDDDAVLNLMKSPAGIDSFKQRIATYRQLAPNAKLLSSPGGWKPDDQYPWFAQVDALLDLRSNIFHAANNERQCLLKPDGQSIGVAGKSLNEALAMGEKLNADRMRMNRLWGATGKLFVTGDAAVTSCGWGEAGQAAIINKLVDRMDCLYQDGWRGANFRNKGPDNLWERAMGVKNEGQFTYSNGPNARAAMKRGLERAIQIMRNGPSCIPPPPTPLDVTVLTGSSQHWAQLKIDPPFDVAGVSLEYNGQTVRLSKASWGDEWVSSINITPGTTVKVVVDKTSGGTSAVTMYWLQAGPSPATPSPSTPTPSPATPTPSAPAPSGPLRITPVNSNEYWVQLEFSSNTGVSSASLSYLGVILPLKQESYGHWTASPSSAIPVGTAVTVNYVKDGATHSYPMKWLA